LRYFTLCCAPASREGSKAAHSADGEHDRCRARGGNPLPEDWSAGDVASAFAEVLGRPVVPVLVPPERRAALLAEEGVPGEVASALLDMYEGIANGLFMQQHDSERLRGSIL
jgi:hypothetical protein